MNIMEKIDTYLNETSPLVMVKSDVKNNIKNKPKKTKLKILDRYWIEMAKNKDSYWYKMNNTEKKTITKWFNNITDMIRNDEDPFK